MSDLSPWWYNQGRQGLGPQAGLPRSRELVQNWMLAGEGVPGLPVG